jgi:hypothetical protein
MKLKCCQPFEVNIIVAGREDVYIIFTRYSSLLVVVSYATHIDYTGTYLST